MGERLQTLLLVEDSEDDARLVIRALNNFEDTLNIVWAPDGHEGLSLLGLIEDSPSIACIPDLVICDIKMPRVGGIGFLETFKSAERLRDIPIVMFSTSTHDVDVERCMELGADDYCFKPFDVELFADCVRDIVNRWLSSAGKGLKPSCLLETASELRPDMA